MQAFDKYEKYKEKIYVCEICRGNYSFGNYTNHKTSKKHKRSVKILDDYHNYMNNLKNMVDNGDDDVMEKDIHDEALMIIKKMI